MTDRWRSPEGYTIPGLLRRGVERWPDRVCVEFEDLRITYDEMWRRSIGVANGLHELGLKPGDTVTIQSMNCAEILYVTFGAGLLGVLAVPISYHHRGLSLAHQMSLGDPKVAFVEQSRCNRVAEILRDVETLTHVFTHGDASTADDIPLDGVKTDRTDTFIAAHESGELAVDYEPRPGDPFMIQFTSGTTGPPKGGVFSHNYIMACALTAFDQKRASSEDIFWSPLPLFHGNALLQTVLGPMYHGARGSLDPTFSVSRFWSRIRAVGATQVSVLGSMITMLWNQPRQLDDADNPVQCLYGAPMPADIHHAFEERFGLRYITAYGLGEAFPIVISTYDDPPPPGTCGKAWERFEVMLVDDDDNEVAAGEPGEFAVRPREPHVMFSGFYRDPGATLAAQRNLWHHTGDYGRVRPDGWYEFVDRKRDYMRRRGENVSSWEVEQVVLAHPAVLEAAAFAVPSDVTEDDIMILVSLKDGTELSHQELMDHCVANLPYFAAPRYVEFTEDQLSNALGKIPKFELRARGVTTDTWDCEAAGYVIKR